MPAVAVGLTPTRPGAMIFATMLKRVLLLWILSVALAAAPRAFASDQPIELSSPHFTLVTDSSEKQARHILDNFEQMRWMFQTLFPKANVDPSAPIIVFAAKNKKGFEALEPPEYLAKGQLSLAGYFLTGPDKNLILLRLDAENEHPFATVYHEYTHLQFRSAMEWMPLWLNEGLAEFFQNTDFKEKQVLLGQPSPDDILYLREHQLIPVETLFRVDRSSPYYHQESKGSVFYAESWALTHYLEISDKEKGTNRIGDYFTRMSKHEDPIVAAQEAFGDLKQLQKQLSYYIEQHGYKQFVLSSASAPIDPASYKLRALTAAQYDADRADFMAYIGREKDARALLQSVMAADPKSAQARETIGYIEFREGNLEDARKWFGEAVALDSQSYLAHYYFAAMSHNNSEAQDDPRVESSLRAAIKLNPRYAPAYDLLASLYARQHDKLEEAQSLNLRAIEFDRGNLNYRINAANLLVMRSKYDDAEKVLRAAQPLAKDPGGAAMLASRIDQIESMKKSMAAQAAAYAAASDPNHLSNQTSTETTSFVKMPDGTVARVARMPVSDAPPKHPTEPANGPKHIILGTIHNAQCSTPAYLEFEIAAPGKPKPVAVYTNDRFKLDLTAFGFTPPAEMNPCLDLEGWKARVQYAETTDKTIDGQVVLIELRK